MFLHLMNKIYISLLCCMTLVLGGCFSKKTAEPVITPTPVVDNEVVVDDEQIDAMKPIDEEELELDDDEDEIVVPEDYSDELDENGEFDPTKFEDDDVDEIMKLMNELIAE